MVDFKKIAEINRKKKEKLKKERELANKNVKRSYRLTVPKGKDK